MRAASEIGRDLRLWASRAANRSLAPPDWLTVNVTLRCNLSCTMCTTCYDSPELSTREICDLVDQAADWGVRVFNPLGGEPFVRPDLEEILAHAARRDMHVTLTTNGTLIRPERAARIARIPVEKLHINLSLDGPEGPHDEVRGPGSFRRALAGYHALREADAAAGNPQRKIGCNSILHRKNLASYLDFVDWLEAEGFDGVQLLNLFRDRGDDMVGGMWFLPDDLPALEGVIAALCERPFLRNAPADLRLVPRYYRDGVSPLEAPCWAGWKELYVNADGSAIMCDGKLDFLAGRFGSVREATLRQLWDSPVLRARRAVVKQCSTPCVQNCYLRRESDAVGPLVREAGELLARRAGWRPAPRWVDETLTLEASDTPDEADNPLLRRLFSNSPVSFASLLDDPDRLAELRDLHYLDFGRGFLGAQVAERILRNVEDGGQRYTTIALRWRGEPLLHPELDALVEAVLPFTRRVLMSTSGRLLGPARARLLSRAGVEVFVDPSISLGVRRARAVGFAPRLAPAAVGYAISWEGRVVASPADVRLRHRIGDALKEPWSRVIARAAAIQPPTAPAANAMASSRSG